MKYCETSIKGVYEIKLSPIVDERGYFVRTYDFELMGKYWLNAPWTQENQSLSLNKDTVRGFHIQKFPHQETKLLRVVRGALIDFYLDCRPESPTFGQHGTIYLTDEPENMKMLFIPKGVANCVLTLQDNTVIAYKVCGRYNPDSEVIIKWDDPDLNINWGIIKDPIISVKDNDGMSWESFVKTVSNKMISPLKDYGSRWEVF